ncbi:MAG: hypothetical protein K8H75_16655 [Sulfuricella sp.]|nr:hypothetical protein [Sulfuricella sp.]
MPYKNDPPVDTATGFAVSAAINEVLSWCAKHPDLVPFLAILAASTAGEELPVPQPRRAKVFFESKRQDFIDADGGALGFVRWARADREGFRELKRILFST